MSIEELQNWKEDLLEEIKAKTELVSHIENEIILQKKWRLENE